MFSFPFEICVLFTGPVHHTTSFTTMRAMSQQERTFPLMHFYCMKQTCFTPCGTTDNNQSIDGEIIDTGNHSSSGYSNVATLPLLLPQTSVSAQDFVSISQKTKNRIGEGCQMPIMQANTTA